MHYLNFLDGITDFEEAKKICKEKNLIVKEYNDPDLYILKYDKNSSDLTDSEIRKCRGLVLSKRDNSVVCLVPIKSVSNDSFNNNFNKNPKQFKIQDFVDGTMINVFYYNGIQYISTRSCLNAKCKWESDQTFAELFKECLGNTLKNYERLDENYCYSFVIQHPENTIVKKYLVPDLLLTLVSKINSDGSVMFYDPYNFVTERELDFRTPTEINFNRIEDIYGYVNSLDDSEQGVVIHDISNNSIQVRTKIRNSKYDYLRKLKGSTNNKLYLFFELRKRANGAFENYLNYFEEDRVLFNKYRNNLYHFTQRLFQNYLDCFANKDDNGTPLKRHKDIDYELKPLVAELHGEYLKTKKKTTKNTVIQYLHNLPIPRLIFAITYSNN